MNVVEEITKRYSVKRIDFHNRKSSRATHIYNSRPGRCSYSRKNYRDKANIAEEDGEDY